MKLCKCGKPRRATYARLCRDCHNEYMRDNRTRWEKANPVKQRARWYLRTYIKRGKVKRLPCKHCGDLKSEAHHNDYSKPLDVVFLCRGCHVMTHKLLNCD